jgi:hypothetical protein
MDTGLDARLHTTKPDKGIDMANARIDRMLRELHSEPALQFFQGVFILDGPVPSPAPNEDIPLFLLKQPSSAN